MGFDNQTSRNALIHCKGNLDDAIDYLINGPELEVNELN
jgi:hypothetical protein